MNRLMLITAGAVGIAALAFAGIVISTGGRPGSPSTTAALPEPATESESIAPAEAPPEVAAASQTAPQEAVPPSEVGAGQPPEVRVAEDAGSRATFETMAQSLRPFGIDVSAETVGSEQGRIVALGLSIAGPEAPLGWRWSMDQAYLQAGEDGSYTITTSGPQTVTLARGDNSAETCAQCSSGCRCRVGIEVSHALSVADGRFSFGLTGQSALSRIELHDLVVPDHDGTPFGSMVEAVDMRVDLGRIDAAPAAQADASDPLPLTVRYLGLDWGTLHLTGDGHVGLDDARRPTGQFQVRIKDVLTMLDAVHAKNRLDREVLATTYARLLQDMATRPDGETMPFSLDIRDGKVILSGDRYGLADIELVAMSR